MNNKNLIKSYEQVCSILKNDKSEEAKQKYLILFKELDLQLNKEFESKLESLSATAPNLREEIRRIENILVMIKYRAEYRRKMIEDHQRLIGYNPLELEEIAHLEDEEDYVAYKTNLIVANEIVVDLIKSGKRVGTLKNQLKKKSKNKKQIEEEIERIQKDRSEKLEALKANEAVLNDLYDYCLTAPFNEENAYIEYIMIKLNPKGELKINLNNVPKRTVKKREANDNTKPLEEMPIIPSLGSVKPNNILNYMENTIAAFDDINIPANGLVETTKKVKISPRNIKKD